MSNGKAWMRPPDGDPQEVGADEIGKRLFEGWRQVAPEPAPQANHDGGND